MKPFTVVAFVFLILVAAGHLIRLALGLSVVIEGIAIPLWMSGAAMVFLAALAGMVWKEHRHVT